MELRKRVRHRLAVDAVFTWRGAEDSWLHGEGETRDISVAGAFIISLTCPTVGATIQLDMLLLPLDSGARSLRLKTEAAVIRGEHNSAGANEHLAVRLEELNIGEGANRLGVI